MDELKQQKYTDSIKLNSRKLDRLNYFRKLYNPSGEIDGYADVGCGNAEITSEISNIYNIKRVYGIDMYPKSEFKTNDININYIRNIDCKIDIPECSIELVTCFMSIHHFEDFYKMISEIYRILRKGGFFFIREHDVNPENENLVMELNTIHKKYEHYMIGNTINYYSRNFLKEVLTNKFSFKHIADTDYPSNVNNKQAIYHTIYEKI